MRSKMTWRAAAHVNSTVVHQLRPEETIRIAQSILVLACLAITLMGCSQNSTKLLGSSINQVDEEVRQSFDRLVEASESLDSKRYFELFDADKFVGLSSDGTNWNSIADLRDLIEPGFNAVDKVQSLTFTNVQISVIDIDTAILVNEYSQVMLLKTGETVNAAGGGTQVWSRASGAWKIVSVSASNRPTTSSGRRAPLVSHD